MFSEIVCIFAALEPAKPLNDAQMCGSIFFRPMNTQHPHLSPFQKNYTPPEVLLQLLQERGLKVEFPLKTKHYLQYVGYYRLSGYMYPFLEQPKEKHQYKPGTSFEQVMRLYRFDKKLRLLLFNEIAKIEVAVRSRVVSVGCEMLGNPFWMLEANNFVNLDIHKKTLDLMEKEFHNSREEFIVHFRNTYSSPFPPAWMMAEILPFGVLTKLYDNIKSMSVKKQVAQAFGLDVKPFKSWLTLVQLTRNSCCHHARVWNRQNAIRPMIPKNIVVPWDADSHNKLRVYANIWIIKYFLNSISPQNDMLQQLLALFSAFPEVDATAMGFPPNWYVDDVWK